MARVCCSTMIRIYKGKILVNRDMIQWFLNAAFADSRRPEAVLDVEKNDGRHRIRSCTRSRSNHPAVV